MSRTIDFLATLAGSMFVALAFLTTGEVLMRKFFNHSLMGVDEIGGYVYAIGSAIGFIAALQSNSHIRVEIILSHLSVGPRLVLNIASYMMLGAFAVLLTWRAGAQLLRSWELGALAPTPLRTPLVIPQGIWLALLSLFSVLILAKLFKAIRLIFSGSENALGEAAQLLDASSAESETKSELDSLKGRNRGEFQS